MMTNSTASNKRVSAQADGTDIGINGPASEATGSYSETQARPLSAKHFLQALGLSIGLGLIVTGIFLSLAPTFCDWGFAFLRPDPLQAVPADKDIRFYEREVKKLTGKNYGLQNRLKNLVPQVPYLIVDTSENQFYLKRGPKAIRQGVCSTGSYTLLKTKDDNQQWIFKTPRGMFRIQGKVVSPTWRMPDWAFIEEGRPIPPENSPERYERGVLGDYALALGDGYLIHGTLYQRFLGLAVTHGCVRLGDDDLEAVFNHLEMGSKVFIY